MFRYTVAAFIDYIISVFTHHDFSACRRRRDDSLRRRRSPLRVASPHFLLSASIVVGHFSQRDAFAFQKAIRLPFEGANVEALYAFSTPGFSCFPFVSRRRIIFFPKFTKNTAAISLEQRQIAGHFLKRVYRPTKGLYTNSLAAARRHTIADLMLSRR